MVVGAQVAKGAKGEAWTGVRNFPRGEPREDEKGRPRLFLSFRRGQGDRRHRRDHREAYPDPSDKTGKFVCVDLKADKPLKTPVTMAEIKADKAWPTWHW